MKKKYILIIFYLCFCEQLVNSHSKCSSIQATISQTVLNQGFHREIKYVINVKDRNFHDVWSNGVCKLGLLQRLPPGAYVNSDELAELRRLNKIIACPVGEVDIEKPKHMSPHIIVYIFSSMNSSRVILHLPIHLRYHKAKSKGGRGTVKIRHPWVLLRCPNNLLRMCDVTNSIIAPCADCSFNKCSWHNITSQPLTEYLEMSVPVGNLDDFTNVVLITFFVCFAGCLYIVLLLHEMDNYDLKPIISSPNRWQKKEN